MAIVQAIAVHVNMPIMHAYMAIVSLYVSAVGVICEYTFDLFKVWLVPGC